MTGALNAAGQSSVRTHHSLFEIFCGLFGPLEKKTSPVNNGIGWVVLWTAKEHTLVETLETLFQLHQNGKITTDEVEAIFGDEAISRDTFMDRTRTLVESAQKK